jgi:glycosyltransferase involved in cell wall biosynthesis
MANYKASVIIPTLQGANKIGVLLRALNRQTVLPAEIIVVIDGSTDETEELVNSFSSLVPVKILKQKNQGRSITKNNGAKAATADILIFFDDDMEPASTSVSKHIEFHNQHDAILAGNQIDATLKSNTDIQNYKVYLSRKWTQKYEPGLNKLDASNLFFSTANCSIKRTKFKELGGFNELLTDAEDFEFASRVLQGGGAVYFDKSNVSIHHDKITCSNYIRRQMQYREARKKLSALEPGIGLPEIKVSPMKRFVYKFFEFGWWPTLIDNYSTILKLLPKKVRYKIYDFVIYAQTYLRKA